MRVQTVGDATLVKGTNTLTNLASLSDKKDSQDLMVRPSKLRKLDNDNGASFSSAGLVAPSATVTASSSVAAFQSSKLEAQNMEKQALQVMA